MLPKLWTGQERRRFRRHEVAIEIDIEVEIYGFASGATPFFAAGKTVNISRSGILAHLDAPVTRGAVCNVFFREALQDVRPQQVSGKVTRCAEWHGVFIVAVEFDAPLERLGVADPENAVADA